MGRLTQHTPLLSSITEPPRWAQDLLEGLLPPDRAENVCGDLLEQYRESALPGQGRSRADRWYLRQVLGFLWRLCAPFAALTAVAVIARTLADAFAPPDVSLPHPYQFRSMLTTYSAAALYLTAGFYGGLKTRRAQTGTIVAVTSHAVGHLVSIGCTLLLDVFVIVPNVDALREFEITGGWGEQLGIPIVLLPAASLLGLAGGIAGKILGARPHARVTE